MREHSVIGLDLAKNVLQVHLADRHGKKVGGRQLKRSQVIDYFANLPPSLIGIESCGGAHEWARRLIGMGHTVKMMAPQHVKAYVQGNKTDARDAAAIAEAAVRQSVPQVKVRTQEEQQVQSLHRVRELWKKHRIAIGNQIRGLLSEFGEAIPQGAGKLKQAARQWLQSGHELPILAGLIHQLLEQIDELEARMAEIERQIALYHHDNEQCQQLSSIPGIGVLTASAVVAAIGNASHFASGRKLASWIGLTPREHSSDGKQTLLGISKRGNSYLRYLLIHGARSVLRARQGKPQYANDWVVQLAQRRGHNIAAVALAAKNARCIWALLQKGGGYLKPQEALAA